MLWWRIGGVLVAALVLDRGHRRSRRAAPVAKVLLQPLRLTLTRKVLGALQARRQQYRQRLYHPLE